MKDQYKITVVMTVALCISLVTSPQEGGVSTTEEINVLQVGELQSRKKINSASLF